ncbi:MAG: ATP-binding protein, partial [Ginsengibacter sp.]
TAHHANDNIETVLMNFFKGTGIHGLTGIAAKQNKIIRPLLFAGKQDILTFADQNSLDFVEDSSNLSDKYTRNFFRRRLLPEIQKIFPEAEANVVRNISRFKEIETLYQQAITIHKKKLLEKKGNEIHIPVLKLLKSEPLAAILYEIVRDFSFTSHQVNEIIKLLKSESGKYISSATHTILKNRSWLIISPVQSADASHIVIEKGDAEIVFSRGILTLQTIETGKFSLPNDNSIALLDAHAIQFPLLLRKWKNGDYFYPLGMTKPKSEKRGKKKVSKFLVDQKLSLNEKENIYVIESNKKILWIIGRRIDDRFKITRTTTMALKINYTVY